MFINKLIIMSLLVSPKQLVKGSKEREGIGIFMETSRELQISTSITTKHVSRTTAL
ncbi:hypothetical protein AAHE18_11G224700 [Arachis hypogaea]